MPRGPVCDQARWPATSSATIRSNAVDAQRQVALTLQQPGGRPGHMVGEPAPMGKRDHGVLGALPDGDRDPDGAQLEAPVADKRQVIVEPAPDPGPDGIAEQRRTVLREVAVQGGPINGTDSSSPSISATWSALTSRSPAPKASRKTCSAAGSEAAAPNSSWFSGAIPSSQSRSSASYGATLAIVATPATRSGSSAAHASACGPPPDQPMTNSRSSPISAASARMSGATSATDRPGRRVESAYPGRPKVTKSEAVRRSRSNLPRGCDHARRGTVDEQER